MPPTVTEVDERLSGAIREVGQKLDRQGEKLAAIEESLGWVKRIGGFFIAIGVLVFTAIVSLSWNASALNSEVKQQGTRLEKVEQKLEQQGERLDKVDQRLEQQVARLDKVDEKLEQQGVCLDKLDQKLEQQGARFDKLDQKLDLIIQKTVQSAAAKPKT